MPLVNSKIIYATTAEYSRSSGVDRRRAGAWTIIRVQGTTTSDSIHQASGGPGDTQNLDVNQLSDRQLSHLVHPAQLRVMGCRYHTKTKEIKQHLAQIPKCIHSSVNAVSQCSAGHSMCVSFRWQCNMHMQHMQSTVMMQKPIP